jgi:hypothetical protein
MRRMAESIGRRREKENVILLTHLLILGLLKHLVLFSEDTVEKDGSILEKDEKQGSTSVTQFYVPSIEKIETLEAEGILSACASQCTPARFVRASKAFKDLWMMNAPRP